MGRGMVELPGGTVTMLFTDIDGSTRLLQELGAQAYVEALEDHRRIVREAVSASGGVEVEMQGDSFHFAFAHPLQAVAAACEAQRSLANHGWAQEPLRIRIGLHTGEPLIRGGLYAGLDVHRAARLMSAGHGGQILMSERTAELIAASLPEDVALRDLGQHRLKDLLESEQVFQLLVEGLEQNFPPLRSRPAGTTNLPVQPTRLIGRERELGEVLELLRRDEVRLLTLVGPGGTGKTRLALGAAAELVQEMEGVYFVNLAPLRDPQLVLGTIATTLELKGRQGQTLLAALAAHLDGKRALLLIDNMEHVAESAPLLAELLGGTRGVKLLLTSRAPLHLSGEREYAVPPLAGDEAVTLFAERARAVKPAFTLDDGGVVEEICRRVDNLPLAIELAAARIKLLPERMLLERLHDRFKLLSGGARDLAHRQQTLRATIDWSYDLLTSAEQTLLRRLAVFAGGRTLEAIEQVCDPRQELGVFDGIASLLDKSLLQRQEVGDGAPRFVMLETIQVYAAERLEQSDERAEFQHRHAEVFLDLAEHAWSAMQGPDQARWTEILELEHDNFRTALDWCIQGGDPQLGLVLASRLWRFWLVRGYLSEGRRWLETALASAPAGGPRALALRGVALIAWEQGDYERVRDAANRALSFDREAGEEAGVAFSLNILGLMAGLRGDVMEAERYLEEAAAISRSCGDRHNLASCLHLLGETARLRGDLNAAADRQTDALAVYAELEDRIGETLVMLSQADVARERGDHEHVFSLLARAGEISTRNRYVPGLLDVVDCYAKTFAATGWDEAAARLWGARERRSKEIGYVFTDWPHDVASRAAAVDSVRTRLGDEMFRVAWADGESMSVEQAMAFGRAQSRAHMQSG